ncbi:MAG: hypothetical protein ABIH11_04245 [Candidatus Altiarchaeota archaeon]
MKSFFAFLAILLLAGSSNAVLDYEVYWNFNPNTRPSGNPIPGFVKGLNETWLFYPSEGVLYLLNPKGEKVGEYPVGGEIYSVDVGDLDGDGVTEVAVGHESGVEVYQVRLHGDIGDQAWSKTLIAGGRYVRIADLDGRIGLEVLVLGGYNVALYSSSGSLIWGVKSIRMISTPPVVSDVDSDGVVEILFGAGDLMYLLKTPPYEPEFYSDVGDVMQPINVVDFDGDFNREIVYSTSGGRIYSLSYGDKGFDVEDVYPVSRGVSTGSVVLDLNSDGVMDALVGTKKRSLYAVNHTGDGLWYYTTQSTLDVEPVLGDIDSDGIMEILYPQGDTLYMLDHSSAIWSREFKSSLYGRPLVADITGDHKPEIIVTLNNGGIVVYSSRSMVDRSNAERLYGRAEDFYGKGSFANALAFNDLARNEYSKIGDTEGLLKASRMEKRIEADEFFNMGEVYYEFGYFTSAGELSARSLEIFESIGYTPGIERALVLQKKSSLQMEAEELVDLSQLDYTSGKYNDSKFKILQASRIFRVLNYTEGVLGADVMVERVYGKMSADSYYFLGVLTYFNNTDLIEARHYISKAEDTYKLINDTEGLRRVRDIDRRITADDLMIKAVKSIDSGNMGQALSYALTAREIYTELGYEIGVLKSEDIIRSTGLDVKEDAGQITKTPANPLYIAVAVVFILLAVALIARKKTTS